MGVVRIAKLRGARKLGGRLWFRARSYLNVDNSTHHRHFLVGQSSEYASLSANRWNAISDRRSM
jgi:hypothetical protein